MPHHEACPWRRLGQVYTSFERRSAVALDSRVEISGAITECMAARSAKTTRARQCLHHWHQTWRMSLLTNAAFRKNYADQPDFRTVGFDSALPPPPKWISDFSRRTFHMTAPRNEHVKQPPIRLDSLGQASGTHRPEKARFKSGSIFLGILVHPSSATYDAKFPDAGVFAALVQPC